MVLTSYGAKNPISIKNVAIVIIASLFLIQILSILISAVFPGVAVIKGGAAVLIMLLAIGIITLFIVGTKIDELDKNKSLVFIVIVFALIALAYWKLPTLIPQIFSIEPGISQTIKSIIGNIMGGVF